MRPEMFLMFAGLVTILIIIHVGAMDYIPSSGNTMEKVSLNGVVLDESRLWYSPRQFKDLLGNGGNYSEVFREILIAVRRGQVYPNNAVGFVQRMSDFASADFVPYLTAFESVLQAYSTFEDSDESVEQIEKRLDLLLNAYFKRDIRHYVTSSLLAPALAQLLPRNGGASGSDGLAVPLLETGGVDVARVANGIVDILLNTKQTQGEISGQQRFVAGYSSVDRSAVPEVRQATTSCR